MRSKQTGVGEGGGRGESVCCRNAHVNDPSAKDGRFSGMIL